MSRILLAIAVVGCCACSENVARPAGGDGQSADAGGHADTQRSPDRGVLIDLPAHTGDPCAGLCAGAMICVAGQCIPTCTADPCNDKRPECPTGQACVDATDFADACFDADAKEGDWCDEETICEAGTFCYNEECVRLCKYGCGGGDCRTRDGCEICY